MTGAKGVLLELMAPWCGHCKQLVPVMSSLAAAIKADADLSSRFVLAKGDADAHRALGETFGVRGFPTLKFIPRGKKAEGAEDYRGGRTVDDFLEFLKTRAAAAKDAVDVDVLKPLTQKMLAATGAAEELRGAADEARAAVDAIASDDAYKGKMPAANAHAALLARAADKAAGAKKKAGEAAAKWLKTERDRLERVLATGSSVSAAKLEDMALKADVLTAILASKK